MTTKSQQILLLMLTGAFLFSACERQHNQVRQEQPREPSVANQAQEIRADADQPQNDWQVVDEAVLTNEQRERVQYARESQGMLGQKLIGTVMQAAQEQGFVHAVDICHTQAPAIANEVAESRGVRIGRSSTRLRNPDNQPPGWARGFIEADEPTQVITLGPEGQIGTLAPIHLAPPCVNCHGEKGQLAEGVSDILARLYPDDSATGYSVGDLRGWFWVEVPPSVSP